MITVTIMLSLAIGILLGAVVNQNHKIAKLEEDINEYYHNSKHYNNQLVTRTHELEDMYQSMNARFNKHMMEHIMKGRI